MYIWTYLLGFGFFGVLDLTLGLALANAPPAAEASPPSSPVSMGGAPPSPSSSASPSSPVGTAPASAVPSGTGGFFFGLGLDLKLERKKNFVKSEYFKNQFLYIRGISLLELWGSTFLPD